MRHEAADDLVQLVEAHQSARGGCAVDATVDLEDDELARDRAPELNVDRTSPAFGGERTSVGAANIREIRFVAAAPFDRPAADLRARHAERPGRFTVRSDDDL